MKEVDVSKQLQTFVVVFYSFFSYIAIYITYCADSCSLNLLLILNASSCDHRTDFRQKGIIVAFYIICNFWIRIILP